MADKKIGVYICTGFGISDAIDTKKLLEEMKGEENVVLAKLDKDLCTQTGADRIKNDIEKEGLDAVVIGGSSPRYHTDLFYWEGVFVERVSLRELVAWTQQPNDEQTQALASDYMKMGLAKARLAEVPKPLVLDINDTILVVGGGFTGMTAAIAAAEADYPVILCEKEPVLGGFYRKMHKITPTKDPYFDLEPNTCEELSARCMAHPKIKVLTNCKIKQTSGQPGLFNVTADQEGEEIRFQAGAIVQATGWKPDETKKLKKFGYGEIPNAVTNIEFEEMAAQGKIETKDGSPIKSVVFAIDAGLDDDHKFPYCSTISSTVALKQALYVREKYPEAKCYAIYRNMRTPGQYEMFYKRVQDEENVYLTKGEIVNVSQNGGSEILVDVDGTLVGDKIQIAADMLVLSNGMAPSTLVEEVRREILAARDAERGAGDEEKKEEEKAEGEEDSAMDEAPNADVLHLTYRQGPDLPVLKYGFPDSHYVCFPYETRRTGIYAAGAVRSPLDLLECEVDARGAAMKAIQIIENTRRGTTVHPRALDKSFADFFLQRCTQCKRCTEECPFGTLDEDKKGTPLYNPNRCRRCGICMGACPERIISFKDYSVHIISSMIKSIYIPTEEEDGEATPRIIAFLCENDAYPSLDMIAEKGIKLSPYIRVIPVRCLGSLNTSWIADSLSQGFDGALLIGCKYGDDYQCHFIKGSELANRRMENVQEKLKQLVLEPERVEIHTLSIDEYDRIPEIFNTFAETIEGVGPNPYKEM